jgi:hypothetical protein
MEFPHEKSVVHLQHPTTSLFLEQDDMIEVYRHSVTRLAKVALGTGESMDLIADITREFKGIGVGNRTKAAR